MYEEEMDEMSPTQKLSWAYLIQSVHKNEKFSHYEIMCKELEYKDENAPPQP